MNENSSCYISSPVFGVFSVKALLIIKILKSNFFSYNFVIDEQLM